MKKTQVIEILKNNGFVRESTNHYIKGEISVDLENTCIANSLGEQTFYPSNYDMLDVMGYLSPKNGEVRVYVVNVYSCQGNINMISPDSNFIAEAERQGTVYTLEGFEKAFNAEEINQKSQYIRILTV